MAVANDTAHATILADKGKFLLMSETKETYKVLETDYVQDFVSELLQTSLVKQKPHCLTAIYFDKVKEANKLCAYNILLNGLYRLYTF